MYIKQLSDWVFVFIRNDQGLGTFITYLNLDSWFRISQKPHPSMQISNTYRYLAGRIEKPKLQTHQNISSFSVNFCVSWLSVIKCVSERLAKKSDHNVKFTFCISSCLTTSLQNSYSSLPALTKPSLLTDRDILPNAQCYWTISTNLSFYLGLSTFLKLPNFLSTLHWVGFPLFSKYSSGQ